MQFKIDENVPVEVADMLREAGHIDTVHAEKLTGTDDKHLSIVCRTENRVLITLDIGFADIRTYPPNEFPGFLVVRSKRQDKPFILDVFQRLIPIIEKGEITGKLWIVEEKRIRVRS